VSYNVDGMKKRRVKSLVFFTSSGCVGLLAVREIESLGEFGLFGRLIARMFENNMSMFEICSCYV